MSASFIVSYETHDEKRTHNHRLHVSPVDDETNWEALIRVIQGRGLKLLDARTVL